MSFSLGQVVVTPGAHKRLSEEELSQVLRRHSSGDWGDVSDEQRNANNGSLEIGQAVYSKYILGPGKVVRVQTDAERSSSLVEVEEEAKSGIRQFGTLFAEKLMETIPGDFLYITGRALWLLATRHKDRNKNRQ